MAQLPLLASVNGGPGQMIPITKVTTLQNTVGVDVTILSEPTIRTKGEKTRDLLRRFLTVPRTCQTDLARTGDRFQRRVRMSTWRDSKRYWLVVV